MLMLYALLEMIAASGKPIYAISFRFIALVRVARFPKLKYGRFVDPETGAQWSRSNVVVLVLVLLLVVIIVIRFSCP